MRTSLIVGLAFTLIAAATLTAQMRPRLTAPPNWVSVYGQMYTGMGTFEDPDSDSRWEFADNSFGLGAALQRQFGQTVLLGVDLSLARPDYEARRLSGPDTVSKISGGSTVATATLLGRAGYGGASDLGFYLTGGLGTIAYKLEHLDGWNSDFALRFGTGLEYRYRPSGSLFLEWGKIWGYHEKEGVSGGRVTHTVLKLGGRFGF
jgi:opacity protein-like surface antigen